MENSLFLFFLFSFLFYFSFLSFSSLETMTQRTQAAVTQFLTKVNAALQKGDGVAAALLFRPRPVEKGPTGSSLFLPPLSSVAEWTRIEGLCEVKFSEPMSGVLLSHLRMLAEVSERPVDFAEAFGHQVATVTTFLKAYEQMEGWANPLLVALITTLQVLAAKADLARLKAGTLKSEEAARLLLKVFHTCQMDRSSWERSRKAASLQVVNTLFKIYFRLKQHRLCQPLIRAIGNDPASLDRYPASYRVTFRFYTGLLAFYEENFPKAEEDLTHALRHCHRDAIKNKRLFFIPPLSFQTLWCCPADSTVCCRTILSYLIPIKLLRGKGVNAAFVKRIGLSQFSDLIQSVKLGNVRLFNSTLKRNERAYIVQGVYLIVERLKLLVYLNLFKRV